MEAVVVWVMKRGSLQSQSQSLTGAALVREEEKARGMDGSGESAYGSLFPSRSLVECEVNGQER